MSSVVQSSETRKRKADPYLSFRFLVTIGNIYTNQNLHVVGGFNEVTGLGFETQTETFREGGENLYEHQLTGPTKASSRLTLKRGLAARNDLWSWYQRVMQGRIERMDLSIILLDHTTVNTNQETELMRWNFQKACPVKWTGPTFRAGAAEVAFESIEFIHQGPLLLK